MQNQSRINEKDLRKYLYPQNEEYEREKENIRSPIARNLFNKNRKQNLELHYCYDDKQLSPSSYILNKELSRNAVGYPRDETQFSVLDNNYTPFSYASNKNKSEGKIYHYSVAARKDYSRDKEEEYNSYYYPEQRSNKYYLEKRNPYNENNYLYRRYAENILPTKVYISDSYPVKKSDPYKFRPSREKDGYKGGIVNLRRRKYSNFSDSFDDNSIILIQRWWRDILNKRRSRNEHPYYNSIASRKTYSRENKRISERIIPGENDKFIIQTTRVEVFKRLYMNIPLLKPEIITKVTKSNSTKKNYASNDFEIVLDRETLKEHMRNIWNEENISTSAESLSIVQNEPVYSNININEMKRITINSYEEQIKQLKIALSKKERELIESSNQLKKLSNKRISDYRDTENFLKRDEIEVFGIQKQLNTNLKKQLIDNLFIRNYPNTLNYRNKPINRTDNIIENMYNIEIIPIEKEPLKKQLIDSLCIQGEEIFNITMDGNDDDSKNIFRGKKMKLNTFSPEKLLLEASDNLEILPIEKEPLKKQLVDNLFIEKIFSLKPENRIQNIDKMTIFKTPKPQNIIEGGDNIEILPSEKEPLKKQLIDALFIEGLILLKEENKIQNIDKLTILKCPKPQNMIEIKDNIEILPNEKKKEPLKKQLVDNLYIERLASIKPDNKIQNLDKLSIFRTPKPINIIEGGDNIEILSQEKEPLKKQLIDALFIEGLNQMKPNNIIQETDKLSIFKTPKLNNIIETKDNIELLPMEREPLRKQLVDDLYIENSRNIKSENRIQNTVTISIFKAPRPDNIIEAKESLEISPKEKEPLQKQLVDDLYIEKTMNIKPENKIQNIDKLPIFETPRPDNIIEVKDNIEILPKEKEPLKGQKIDAIYIENLERFNNEIQNTSLMTISKMPKTPNIIEPIENIFISPKEKDPLQYQIIDELLIEGKNKIENEIQNIDKMEIMKTPKQQIYIVEEKENIQILPIEKKPLNKQLVDQLLIEGNMKPDNKIQIVDKMDILKTPKPDNIIENNSNICILPKEKDPLMKQLVDDLTIERKIHPNNEIQNIDKIEILESIKPKNVIEEKEYFFIAPKAKEPLKNQIIDSIIIDGNVRGDDYNIQLVDEINILRNKKPETIIESNDSLFIPSLTKEPLRCQFIDKILVEGNALPDNEIQNVDKLDILKTPKQENIIQENDNIFIGPKEKEPLKLQLIDNIKIFGTEKDDNSMQTVDKIEILRTSKIMPSNRIEEKESLFIKSKTKDPLKMQLIDKLFIEGSQNLTKVNEIQEVNKLEIPRKPKPENVIEEKEAIFIKSKEKQPLKDQVIDTMIIEGENRPNNEIQTVDKMNILRTPKPQNSVIEVDKIMIEPKEQEPLKKQVCDELKIEGNINGYGNEMQKVDEIKIGEDMKLRGKKKGNLIISNSNLFIPPKSKEPLKEQIVDNILVEGNIKPNNKIQNVDKMNILRTPKPENKIEQKENILISPKEREPLKKQLVDDLLIERTQKVNNNSIQKLDKFEIIKEPKPQNVIEKKEKIYIPSKEKDPIVTQKVDELLIEEETRPEFTLQSVEKLDILTPKKSKTVNVIEQNENILISPKEKEPLLKQLCDNLLIEGNIRNENEIQIIEDKMEILRTPKPKNLIQLNEQLCILPQKKEPLQSQTVDKLLIDGNMDKPNNRIQNIDQIKLSEALRPKNIISANEEVFIPSHKKEPMKSQIIDNISIEGNVKPDNEIQVINQLEILKSIKPNNIVIQDNSTLYIPSKTKEPLKDTKVDNIIIEGNANPENIIQNIDKIEIIKTQIDKPENVIEEKESIFIKPKEKDPLNMQLIDTMIIEGENRPNNEIQTVDKMNILRTPKPQNSVIEVDKIMIDPEVQEPLKKQVCDELIIGGIEKPENAIQNVDTIEIEKTLSKDKNKNIIIDCNDNIFIPPKEKEPYKKKVIDSLQIEGIYKPQNKTETVARIELLKSPKPKNEIEQINNIFMAPNEKEPLELQRIDELIIEEMEKPNNEEQISNRLEILRRPKIIKKEEENKIEKNCAFYVEPKEKGPLEYQLLDQIIIKGIKPFNNVIKNIDSIPIIQERNLDDIVMEENVNLVISPNEKKPLEKQIVDKIIIEGNPKEDNEIQFVDELIMPEIPRPENTIESINDIFIDRKERDPLIAKSVDKLYIEKLIPQIPKKKYIIDNRLDKFTIEPLKEKRKKIEPSTIDRLEENNIEGEKEGDQDNAIPYDKKKLRTKRSPNIIIQKNEELNIIPKEKKLSKPKNIIIQTNEQFNILETPKISDKKPENTISLPSLPNQDIKNILCEDKMDEFIVDGLPKPKNEIETTETFYIHKTTNEMKSLDKIFTSSKEGEKEKIPLSENKIEKTCDYYIPKTQKEPFEKQNIDKIKIDNIDMNLDNNNIPEKEKEKLKKGKNKKEDENKISPAHTYSDVLKNEQMDELKIEGEKRPDNAIETVIKMNINRTEKPKNEIIYSEKIEICPEKTEKKEELKIREFMEPNQIQRIEPINIINNIDKSMTSPLEKKPLLKINNEEIYIPGNKVLSLPKKIQNLQEENANNVCIKGTKKDILSLEKKPLIKEMNQELFIEGITIPKKEENLEKPKIKNEINNIDKIMISSLEKQPLSKNNEELFILGNKVSSPIFIASKIKEPLLEEKTNNIEIINQKKPENEIKDISLIDKGKPIEIKKLSDIEIDYNEPIFISPRRKEPLQKQFINEVYIENKKPENDISLKGKRINYEICPQTESFNIENNIDPEITEELYILRTKYKKLKKEIKPNLENSFFIKGSSSSKQPLTESKINNVPTYQIYQKNAQFSLIGQEKKPYLIDNKGCFNINSSGKKFNNNLIAQGLRFGLLAKPNEPGRKTQGIEKKNWNNENKAQRIFNLDLKGNNNAITWNDFIVSQKGIYFRINGIKRPSDSDLQKINEEQFSIIDKKEEDVIVQGDYNYMSLEKDKDDKQRRTVKATITKIYREAQNDDDVDDFDPFSSCKRHTGKKYDKIFNERKTTSYRIRDNREIRQPSIISNEDDKKKPGTLIISDKGKIIDNLLSREEKDRNTLPVVFKDIKNIKDKPQDIYKFKNIGKSKSQVMFKKKEKKTEYLRDYDNDQQFYN